MTISSCFYCQACGQMKPIIQQQQHHRFRQTKWAKKLYGNLIHDSRNIMIVCADCHVGHQSTKIEFWTELEFCTALGIEPRSKLSLRRFV